MQGSVADLSRRYEISFCICRNGDLSQALNRGEEHDARDAIPLYKETMCENMLEFDDPSAVERKLTIHELRLSGHDAAVQSGYVAKVARIEDGEDERRK